MLSFFEGKPCALGQKSNAYTNWSGDYFELPSEGVKALSGTDGGGDQYTIVALEVYAVTEVDAPVSGMCDVLHVISYTISITDNVISKML